MGIIPWKEAWNIFPQNLFSNYKYHGLNVFFLCCMGYKSPYWLTLNQIQKLKGRIREEEKPTDIILWFADDKPIIRKNMVVKNEFEDNEEYTNKESEIIYKFRVYQVYNFEQTENIRHKISPVIQKEQNIEKTAQDIIDKYKNRPKITYKIGCPEYNLGNDLVNVPPKDSFNDWQEYYSSIFHELIHSTGHQSRLKRKSLLEFVKEGDHDYSYEELIAEFGSCFLCGYSGIEKIRSYKNSAAYIQCWLKNLNSEKDWLYFANAQAKKAVNYILGISDTIINKKADNNGHWVEDIDLTA
jgi:antirestriction protein ArdC